MISVRFRAEAEVDLRSIIAWYGEVAPEALDNILADIHRTIDRLTEYPRLGAPVTERSFRRIVTLRYHFKIAYLIEDHWLTILGIFRFQDREV